MSQGFQLEFLSYVRRSSSIVNELDLTKEVVPPSGNRQSERPTTRRTTTATQQQVRTNTSSEEQHATTSNERPTRRASYTAPSNVSVQVFSGGDTLGSTVWHKVKPGSSGSSSDGTQTRSMRSRMKDLEIEELTKSSKKTQLVIMEDEDDTEIMIQKKFPCPGPDTNGTAPENGGKKEAPPSSVNGTSESKKGAKAEEKKGCVEVVGIPEEDEESESDVQEKKGQGDTTTSQRPKRQVIPKNLDFASGLSWREQNDLKRALYASLHETKKLEMKPPSNGEDQLPFGKKPISRNKSLSLLDESSQDSTRSAVSSETSQEQKDFVFRGRVRAQRKFAQGSRPCSPQVSPVKAPKPTPKKKKVPTATLR